MIRSITTSLLLIFSITANADTLYRWQETDGSITFSPKPPAAAIAYEKVESGKRADDKRLEAVAATSDALPVAPRKKPKESGQSGKVRYAPDINAAGNKPDSQPIAATALATATKRSGIAAENTAATAASEPVVASSNKQRRCQELQKRVVSLERRMRSQLSAEDMDNTVVHMARYQTSFNQHCQR